MNCIMKKSIIPISLFTLVLSSCQEKVTLGFENVVYVKEFPKVQELRPDTTLRFDDFVHSFSIYDTMLVLQTENQDGGWQIYSLNDYKEHRDFFNKGHAFGEVVSIPNCRESCFIKERDSIFAITYDFGNGNIYKTNLSREDDNLHVCSQKVEHDVPQYLDAYVYISDSSYITRETAWCQRPKKIQLYRNGKPIPLKAFEILNQIEVQAEDPINILAASKAYSDKHKKFILTHLNSEVINIISIIDSTDYKSICLNSKMTSAEEAVERFKHSEIDTESNCIYLSLGRTLVSEDYFIVVSRLEKGHDELLKFDYNGTPLHKYLMDGRHWDYQIDEKNNFVYALDLGTSEIKRFPM